METPNSHPPEILLIAFRQIQKLGKFIFSRPSPDRPENWEMDLWSVDPDAMGDHPPLTREDLDEGR